MATKSNLFASASNDINAALEALSQHYAASPVYTSPGEQSTPTGNDLRDLLLNASNSSVASIAASVPANIAPPFPTFPAGNAGRGTVNPANVVPEPQRYYGNGTPVPDGIPGMRASQAEWAAYRQRQAADAMPTTSPMFGVVPQDPAIQAIFANIAGAGRGGPASTGIDASDLNSPAGAGRGFVNPGPGTNPDPSENFLNQAFPEIFRKTPPQGIVNTTYGVERVNARTSETGVTAMKDANGKVTLTNIGPNGQPVQGTGSPNSVGGNGMGNGMNQPLTGNQQLLMPNTSTSLQAAMRSLTDPTTTVDAALGHFQNIQQEIALQQTKMQGDAIKFAETQFGIPDLNAQLQQSLIADKNSPSWYPGIGDSPVTMRIRQAIQSASNDVQLAAKNYLAANTSYSAFSVAGKSAELALKQIEIRNNRKDALTDRAELAAANKAEQKMAARMQMGATLPKEAQDRLAVIDPTLANMAPDEALAKMGDVMLMRKADKSLQDYLTVPQAELPTLAVLGNNYAVTGLKAAEIKAGRTDDAVQADIDNIRKMVTDSKFTEMAIKDKYSDRADKTAMDKELADARISKFNKDPLRREADIKLAIDMNRKKVSTQAVDDIRYLRGIESVLGDSIDTAMKQSGNASIKSVLTAYIGDASGDERIQKLSAFAAAVQGVGAKQPVSIFGMPNGQMIAAAIAEASIVRSPFAALDFLNPFKSNAALLKDYPGAYESN